MHTVVSRSWLWIPGALLCAAAGAFAQSTANMSLYSPCSIDPSTPYSNCNVVDNIYVGPYYATINGVQTAIICDDFADDSFVPEIWTATVSNVSGPLGSSVLFGNNTPIYSNSSPTTGTLTQDQAYEASAWLAEQLVMAPSAATAADIQYALWEVMSPVAVNAYLGSVDTTLQSTINGANGYYTEAVTMAKAGDFSASEFSNVTIYSPTAPGYTGATCPGYPGDQCPTLPPQEFLTVATPEPAQIALLGCDFLGVGMLVFFLRRRRA